MIQRCFALPYYVYCLRLRCLVSFLFYSTISFLFRHIRSTYQTIWPHSADIIESHTIKQSRKQ
ncbi:Uncharacterised protein [Neisseria animalis]|nr:Uncharacterised protein [Neisseria animalis]